MDSRTITPNRRKRETSGFPELRRAAPCAPECWMARLLQVRLARQHVQAHASRKQGRHSRIPVVGQDNRVVTIYSGKSNENGRPALSARHSLFPTPGRMAPAGDLVNADVAVTSMQPKLGTTSRMASLVSMIVDFCHVMNAQLRFLGKAKATPFSVRLRGRVQLWGSGEIVLGE